MNILVKQQIPHLTALYINGSWQLLFEKAAARNKAALMQLVMLNMDLLISLAKVHKKHSSKATFVTVLDALVNGYIADLEALMQTYQHTNTMPSNDEWMAVCFVRTHLQNLLLNNTVSCEPTTSLHFHLPQLVAHLNNLNTILTKLENQAVQQLRTIAANCMQQRENGVLEVFDIELGITVAYCLPESDVAVHQYSTSFCCSKWATPDFAGLLCDGTDWRESHWPILNMPYCYLLHDLIDHSRLHPNEIDSIATIYWDVEVAYQWGIEIDKQGIGTTINFNK